MTQLCLEAAALNVPEPQFAGAKSNQAAEKCMYLMLQVTNPAGSLREACMGHYARSLYSLLDSRNTQEQNVLLCFCPLSRSSTGEPTISVPCSSRARSRTYQWSPVSLSLASQPSPAAPGTHTQKHDAPLAYSSSLHRHLPAHTHT